MVRASKIFKIYAVVVISFITAGICYAGTEELASGMEAYKAGNYANSIEIMKSVVKEDPTSVIGYYYLGLSYAKQGKNILAIQNYNRVINLNSDSALTALARQGKNNIGGKQVTKIEEQLDDIEEEYNPIFNDAAINIEETKKKPVQTENKTTQIIKASDYNKKDTATAKHEFDPTREPTNDEIVNSIKILQKAGLLQNGAAGLTGGMQQTQNTQAVPLDSRAQQMQSMLMMMNGGNNGNNMNMMQMMPYMNNGGKVDPQIMQMMLMNQMMPNFSTGGNGNNGY